MQNIVFTNQKGGVGKSTSCINLSAILGAQNHKILVIDLDPQANCTQGLGIDEEKLQDTSTIYDLLVNEIPAHQAIHRTNFKNVDIIPAHITLANAELELSAVMGRETLLREAIESSEIGSSPKFSYDYILLDLPPTLGLLTVNGLVAAHGVIIPVDAGIFALSGINQLIKIIKLVKRKFNPALDILGALMTKVDSRTNMSREIHSDLQELFKERLFSTVIHQNVKIAEAQKHQMPISYFDPDSKGALEYGALAEELILKGKAGR